MTTKPDLSRVWAATASGSDVVDPGNAKYDAGWSAEIPPYEYFNFLQQVATQALKHLDEEGIPVYGTDTDYPINAYVKGSDGIIYICEIGNGPSSTLRNPVGDGSGSWTQWTRTNEFTNFFVNTNGGNWAGNHNWSGEHTFHITGNVVKFDKVGTPERNVQSFRRDFQAYWELVHTVDDSLNFKRLLGSGSFLVNGAEVLTNSGGTFTGAFNWSGAHNFTGGLTKNSNNVIDVGGGTWGGTHTWSGAQNYTNDINYDITGLTFRYEKTGTAQRDIFQVARDSVAYWEFRSDLDDSINFQRLTGSGEFKINGNVALHTNNIGTAEFTNTSPPTNSNAIHLGASSGATIRISRDSTALVDQMTIFNPNGLVGSIASTGTTTNYNTASDPRLKDFKDAPTDDAINQKFDELYSTFRIFNWKNDPDGQLVWGFDAHACIDAGLDMGSEGSGSRDLEIGEVYDTIPEETEERPVMDMVQVDTGEVDEEGNPIFKEVEQQLEDEEGNPLTETVVVKEAQELTVTPAGVDQSKAVPILLAKLEQLERRIAELEGA